jgi:CheY-like chemotaxis protein
MIQHAFPRPRARSLAEMNLRVLLVDYDVLNGRMLEQRLATIYDVTRVTEASYALERLAKGEHYDVILCEIALPHLNGAEFYRRAKHVSRAAARRIVFMGRQVPPRFEKFLRCGSKRWVSKPIDDVRGIETLARLVAGGA